MTEASITCLLTRGTIISTTAVIFAAAKLVARSREEAYFMIIIFDHLLKERIV
jgi:hypothetical protein